MATLATIIVLLCGFVFMAVSAIPQSQRSCPDGADIVFVIDSSGSVTEEGFNVMKVFVSLIIQQLFTESSDYRFGVITYRDNAQVEFHLNRYPEAGHITTAVDGLEFAPWGTTNTAEALNMLRTEAFTAAHGDRPEMPNIAILITDGRSNAPNETIHEGRLATDAGIHMFVVGVSRHIEEGELTAIASRPLRDYYFEAGDVRGLFDLDYMSGFATIRRIAMEAVCPSIHMFVVGVSRHIEQGELTAIASRPLRDYYFEAGDFRGLFDLDYMSGFATIRRIATEAVCPKQLTTASPTMSEIIISLSSDSTGGAVIDPTTVSVSTIDVVETTSVTPTTGPTCYDVLPDCAINYGNDVCTDFEPWARDNCAAFCGFCIPDFTTVSECVDVDASCSGYGRGECSSPDNRPYMLVNCRLFCEFCDPGTDAVTPPVSTIETTTPVFICRDIEQCLYTDIANCNSTVYGEWSRINCPALCGYCIPFRDVGGEIVGNTTCPVWSLPNECELASYCPEACPLPVCPGDGYTLVMEKQNWFDINAASNA